MPGRLLNERNMNNATTTGDTNHDTPHGGGYGGPAIVNGNYTASPPRTETGGPSLRQQQPQSNGIRSEDGRVSNQFVNGLDQLPPEIHHITDNFLPLSTLLERASQQCFNELDNLVSNTLNSTSNKPMTSDDRINSEDKLFGELEKRDSKISDNDRKKLNWLRFSQVHRDRFIKLLVLLQWSPQIKNVSKLIDLFAWTVEQGQIFSDATEWMGHVKLQVDQIKFPSPDIETALEVLSTGKSAHIPSLGYIQPKTLVPQKIHQTLKDINVSLHIRLNLYETLPPQFRQFTIADGRATFTVPSEFEVDLSIADEDPSTQFYFIDIRLLFKPALEIPANQIKDQLEGRLNDVLNADGLAGCYDFLHDFVLTHKITLLRRQAFEMNRTNWAGSIRIELAHRTLVVQYWLDRPGPKSWFEVGIRSGRPKIQDVSKDSEATSHLDVRWIREGKEVKDAQIPIETDDLSLEQILHIVLARHISTILEATHNSFKSRPTAPVKSVLSASSSNPADCKLSLPLKASKQGHVSVETATGNFVLQPASKLSRRCEEALGKITKPAEELFIRLYFWRASEILEDVAHNLTRFGWDPLKHLNIESASLRRVFGQNAILWSFFKMPSWGNGWVLAVTIGSEEETYWIAKLGTTDQDPSISMVEPIPLERGLDASARLRTRLERLAVATISSIAISHQLQLFGIKHAKANIARSSFPHVPSLEIDIGELLMRTSRASKVKNTNVSSWSNNVTSLVYRGFSAEKWDPNTSSSQLSIMHVARGKLSGDSSVLKTFAGAKNSDVHFEKTGNFWIIIRSPLGSSNTVSDLADRLRRIAYIRRIAEALIQLRAPIESLSSDMISFAYSNNPSNDEDASVVKLVARMTFRKDGLLALNFRPSDTNPHVRIESDLAHYINQSDASAPAFTKFIDLLRSTLPLLRAVDSIVSGSDTASQDSDLAKNNQLNPSAPSFNARGIDRFRITYPRAHLALNVSFKTQGDSGWWNIEHQNSWNTNPYDFNAKVKHSLSTIFSDITGGDGWSGMRLSVVAEPTAVEGVLTKIDALIKEAEKEIPMPASEARPAKNQLMGETEPAMNVIEDASAKEASSTVQTRSEASQSSQETQPPASQAPIVQTSTSNQEQSANKQGPQSQQKSQATGDAQGQQPQSQQSQPGQVQKPQQPNGQKQIQQQKNNTNANGSKPKGNPDVIELD